MLSSGQRCFTNNFPADSFVECRCFTAAAKPDQGVWGAGIAKDIFAFLDARSLVAASEVCVCWSAIESIESEELWGSLCMVDYHVSPAALVSVKKKKKKKEKESLTAKDLYKTSVKRLGALTRNTTKVEVSGLGVTCVDRSLLRL